MLDETLTETPSLIDEVRPLPEGWRRIKLSECLTLYNGRAYSQHEMLNEGTPIIRIQNLNGGNKWFYSNFELPPHQYCDNGDLLYAWSATFGVYVWKGQKAIFHYHIWKVVPKDNLDKVFAFFLLQEITDELKLSSHGLAMLHITKSGMENWFVNLPPIDEQRRIASILDEQMKAVEQVRLSVEEQLAAANLLPNAFLSSVFESEDAENWQKRKLSDVCDVITGGTPPRGEVRFYGGSIPWIKPDDLDRSVYVEKSAEYLTEEGGKISRLLPAGSVLVSCIGNIGKLAIAAKTLVTNQQINSLIPSESVDSLYLYYACKFMKPVFISEASISLVSILNKSGFSEIEIPLPVKSEQIKVAEKLNEQMQAVEILKQSLFEKLAAVKKLPAALLRKAFAGEL